MIHYGALMYECNVWVIMYHELVEGVFFLGFEKGSWECSCELFIVALLFFLSNCDFRITLDVHVTISFTHGLKLT